MPFGLKGAAQTFQRLMDSVLRDMSFLFVYLDDILVASTSVEEHLTHLRQLFERRNTDLLSIQPSASLDSRPSRSWDTTSLHRERFPFRPGWRQSLVSHAPAPQSLFRSFWAW